MTSRPDVVVIMTDQERAAPPYEDDELTAWRQRTMPGRRWFDEHGVAFARHYTGSLACVPSRPTLFTGQYPDVHGVTQTDGLGKMADDSRLRWLREGEVPTLGNWFRTAGYDTHYDGKWHISHADLTDPASSGSLATNDEHGVVDPAAVRAYLDADPLAPFGFSGWVGPEPHGAPLANAGVVRDGLFADRIVAWLEDRYARRRSGDPDALRPFLLVASFVNPHDIVFFPMWARQGTPFDPSDLDPPPVPPSPTDDEDLATKPAAQIAYRASYPSSYGPAPAVARIYERNAQAYRDVYHRLHVEVDGPLDRVRRAVTDGGSDEAVLVRTSDHGELLGSHGGLHQKWYQLYDEATRVPFVVARIGTDATSARLVVDAPTSHVDLVPTLLAVGGIDEGEVAAELQRDFSEVHPLPGRNLLPVVDGTAADRDRVVYLMTRDNMLEGDSGASGLARRLGRTEHPPLALRIRVPSHVATNVEGVVARVEEDGAGHLWKLVRTFDDPDTWTEPGVRQLADTGPGGPTWRTEPVPDQWELYDLDVDPFEAESRWNDPVAAAVFGALRERLVTEQGRCVPERNGPWPYAARQVTGGPPMERPPPPVRLVRRALQRLGLHPEDPEPAIFDLVGRRALVIATNVGVLERSSRSGLASSILRAGSTVTADPLARRAARAPGKPTGVFASELTVPYYAFVDAGMQVDVASPKGGVIPVDPQSLKPAVRTAADDRFLADEEAKRLVTESWPIEVLDMADYDLVYLAGGWGAAFDFAASEELAAKVSEANALGRVIGGVCHGPLGLVKATDTDGSPLVEGRRISAVTDKQIAELGIESTPHHPETELRRVGAEFESATRFRDPLANHWVVDGNLVTGQNQNAAPMVAREMLQLVTQAS